jgi:RNA polymerase sigma factor (sigma-70 family)
VPALVGYLSTSVLHRVQRLQQRWLKEKRTASHAGPATAAARVSEMPTDATSVVGRSVRNEHCLELRRAIAQLEPHDSEIVILRGIEQHPAAEVAAVLGLTANAVNVRYHRALRRLIESVRDSVLVDFLDP